MNEYVQKYSVVSFIEPINDAELFDYKKWPLHVTIADTFACDLDVLIRIGEIVKSTSQIELVAERYHEFGDTNNPILVMLFAKTKPLQTLHIDIVNYLLEYGAVFNIPEYTKEGFLPHCDVQKHPKIIPGTKVILTSLSIVDMFAESDWKKRRIIKTFRFVQ